MKSVHRHANQVLMYNGHWYEWYPTEWAAEETGDIERLEELTQENNENADMRNGGHDDSEAKAIDTEIYRTRRGRRK